MTKKFILGFTIIMFFFKSSAIANYEKTFFDLNIESISGNIINFSDFKDNAVLVCLLYTSPSPRDPKTSRMPSSA